MIYSVSFLMLQTPGHLEVFINFYDLFCLNNLTESWIYQNPMNYFYYSCKFCKKDLDCKHCDFFWEFAFNSSFQCHSFVCFKSTQSVQNSSLDKFNTDVINSVNYTQGKTYSERCFDADFFWQNSFISNDLFNCL